MRDETYERLDDVPADVWDAIAPAAFFLQKPFLRVIRSSGVEDADYRYLALREGDEVVAFAVLSRFKVRLDLLSGDPWVVRARKLLPFLFDMEIVTCGIPASMAQHSMHVVRPERATAAVDRVHGAMEAWAKEGSCSALLWKEWSKFEDPDDVIRNRIRGLGYVGVPTLPSHAMSDLPPTVDEFLGSMRSSYRRKYKVAKKLVEGDGPVWTSAPYRLEESAFDREAAERFHRGYIALMERVKARLETYPLEFFTTLADADDIDTRVLRLVNEENGEWLDALLIAKDDVLTFPLVAKDHADYEDALYALLMRAIALYAIRGGFRVARLGQTSGYAKVSMGARPRRVEAFVKMRGRLRQMALARFAPALFPEEESPELSVYKADEEKPAAVPAG